jgi:hypothetical protein
VAAESPDAEDFAAAVQRARAESGAG